MIDVKLLHPENAPSLILVTLFPMETNDKLSQLQNALLPILVTSSPIVYILTCLPKIFFIDEEYEYDLDKIALLLMETEVKPLQL